LIEVHYFHFSHRRTSNVPSSSQVCKINANKQHLALSKDFSAVSAGGREVIAASPDRQFDYLADFADLSAGSLDNTWVKLFQINPLFVCSN